jgi:hypothetical protein
MEPALDCLNEVHFILDELCKNLIRNECRRFPPVMIEIEERV